MEQLNKETKIRARLIQLDEQKNRMVDYLLLKVDEEDWHGVADAAMDIRDIENMIEGIEWVKNEA